MSDPGWKLAHEALEAGVKVIPIPGASAMLAGLVASGLPSDKFLFAGFLPPKSGARKSAAEALKAAQEAPAEEEKAEDAAAEAPAEEAPAEDAGEEKAEG